MAKDRDIDVVEHAEVPWLSVVLGYGPMLTILAAAIIAWTSTGLERGEVVPLGVLYSASILAFLGGVRRGPPGLFRARIVQPWPGIGARLGPSRCDLLSAPLALLTAGATLENVRPSNVKIGTDGGLKA